MAINPTVGAGLIGAGSTILNTVLGSQLNSHVMNKQQDFNRENMGIQNRYNRENTEWSSKMNRLWDVQSLKMAGLSPAMASMNGSAPSVSAPSSTNPTSELSGLAGGFSTGLGGSAELALLGAQKDNLESQTEKNLADVGKSKAETKQIIELFDVTRDNLLQDLKTKMFTNEKLNPLKAKETEMQIANFEKNWDVMSKNIELMDSQIKVNDATKAKLRKEIQVFAEQIKNLAQERIESGSRIALNHTQSYVNKRTGLYIDEQKFTSRVNRSLASFQNTVQDLLGPQWYQSKEYIETITNSGKDVLMGLGGAAAGAGTIMKFMPK